MIKKLKMKNLNLFFAAALILLMYKTPIFLTDIAASIIGRTILMVILVYILLYCEFSCAILFALIIIVLFHNTVEGLVEGKDGEDKEEDKEGGEDDDEDDEGDEEDDDDEEDDKDSGDIKKNLIAALGGESKKEEGFLGYRMIKDKVLNKKFIGDLRNTLKNNLTDLDRYMKTNSEKNTIASTKQ
jgi:hypothetical protein